MALNHLNLTVDDPLATHDLLVKYFGLKPKGRANAQMALLGDEHGMVLTLMSPSMSRDADYRYPETFHIGFVQPSDAHVNAVHERLLADGFTPGTPSRQHGSWTFYFPAPGAFTIEVLALGPGQAGLAAPSGTAVS